MRPGLSPELCRRLPAMMLAGALMWAGLAYVIWLVAW